jgi:hypothetical protein
MNTPYTHGVDVLPAELSVKQVSVPCLPGILQLTTLTRLNLLVVDVVFLDEDEDEGGYCWSSCYLVRAHTLLHIHSCAPCCLWLANLPQGWSMLAEVLDRQQRGGACFPVIWVPLICMPGLDLVLGLQA